THPIGRREDHLVTRIKRRYEGVIEHLLAASADDDLTRLVVEAVLALELARDGGFEFWNTVDRGVLRRLAAFDRLNGSAFDILRRIEVRLPRPQSNYVAASSFERPRLVRNRDSGGWLEGLDRYLRQGP